MDRVGTGAGRGGEHQVTAQVGVGRCRAGQVHRLVGGGDVRGVAVGVGVQRHGGDVHLAGGADDAGGDLTAVGDEQLG